MKRVVYRDRREAGLELAAMLAQYAGADAVVLGLTRGGVPVAFEISSTLGTPLDVFVVRKLGVPGHDELAMGAIAPGGTLVLNQDIVRRLEIDQGTIDEVAARETREMTRREQAFRRGRPPPHSPAQGVAR